MISMFNYDKRIFTLPPPLPFLTEEIDLHLYDIKHEQEDDKIIVIF